MDDYKVYFSLVDLTVKIIALIIGGTWAIYKIGEYRAFKSWIQLDLDANIYMLARPEEIRSKTWNENGEAVDLDTTKGTHAVEILLKFANKGKTRIKLFNIQVGLNTMRPPNQAKFDGKDGHLHLWRIHTSGNLVPEFPVEGKPIEDTSFYYIEPEVEQTISYLCLVSNPRELLQVFAMFSLEQTRLFPKTTRGPKGLYPHTTARTFQLKSDNVIQANTNGS